MLDVYQSSPLFYGMTPDDIRDCIRCSGAVIRTYEKESLIFHQNDTPKVLHILVEGSVHICFDSVSGKRNVVAVFENCGELFGEVFAFLGKPSYDMYAQASPYAKVLEMPKEQLLGHCPRNCKRDCRYQDKLVSNMLEILAKKAYFLIRKLQILSSSTLRQKIAKAILQHRTPDGKVNLTMSREAFADYLGVTRPSLSRELMKMQQEGFITIQNKEIIIKNLNLLQDFI